MRLCLRALGGFRIQRVGVVGKRRDSQTAAFDDLAHAADGGIVKGIDIDVADARVAPSLGAGGRPACDLQRFKAIVCGPAGDLVQRKTWKCSGQKAKLQLANLQRPDRAAISPLINTPPTIDGHNSRGNYPTT